VGTGFEWTYNRYTPSNYVAGCMAVAMAQVLKWFQYPLSASATRNIRVGGQTWSNQTSTKRTTMIACPIS